MAEEPTTYPPPSDNHPTPERVELAKEAKRLREARGLSIQKLADKAGYNDPDRVGWIENPDKQEPSRARIAAVDNALNAGGSLVALRDRAYDARMKRREALKNVMAGAVTVATLPQSVALDAAYEILERIMRRQVDYVDARVVDELERLVAAGIVDYQVKHSAVIAPDLRRWNQWADRLLLGHQHPSEIERLEAVACKFSGVLAKISSDLGEHGSARLYALESFISAQRLGDDNLQAWSRGMQSMAAYGAGDFVGAVDLARQPGKRSGLQTARLAFDEAKALAKMGDHKGVANAVERGMSSSCAEARDVSRSDVTIGSFDRVHSGRWACYAYTTVGDATNAQKCAEYPLLACDQRVGDPGGAFMRMELATTLAESDPSQAGELVIVAMDYTAKHPLATIASRIKNFLTAARSPKVRNVPAIRDAVDAARAALR